VKGISLIHRVLVLYCPDNGSLIALTACVSWGVLWRRRCPGKCQEKHRAKCNGRVSDRLRSLPRGRAQWAGIGRRARVEIFLLITLAASDLWPSDWRISVPCRLVIDGLKDKMLSCVC